MANKIKAVIFDWGGVVAPNNNGGWVSQLAKLLNINFEDALELWRSSSKGLSTGKISENNFWDLIQQSINKPLPKDKSKIWSDGLASQAFPEILDYVRTINAKGIKTAVLSNTVEPMERIIYLDDLYKDFNFAVLSHRVGIAKPDSEIFYLTLRQLNLLAEQCIFIDDSLRNIEAANKIGFTTINIENSPLETINLIDGFLKHGE